MTDTGKIAYVYRPLLVRYRWNLIGHMTGKYHARLPDRIAGKGQYFWGHAVVSAGISILNCALKIK